VRAWRRWWWPALLLVAVSRAALRPLDRLTALAKDISTGDRGRRLRPDRVNTELGRAASAFDGMLDALEASELRARQHAESAQRAETRDPAIPRRRRALSCAPRSPASRPRPNSSPPTPARTRPTRRARAAPPRQPAAVRPPAAPGGWSPTCWT